VPVYDTGQINNAVVFNSGVDKSYKFLTTEIFFLVSFFSPRSLSFTSMQ
jgi:hypothetical protein